MVFTKSATIQGKLTLCNSHPIFKVIIFNEAACKEKVSPRIFSSNKTCFYKGNATREAVTHKKKWPSCMNKMFTTFTFTSEISRAFQAFNFQLGLKCISIKEQVSLHIKSARN